MRTRTPVSAALAALAILCAAGCCQTDYLYTYPDGTQVVVRKVDGAGTPPPPPQAAVAAVPAGQVVVVEAQPAAPTRPARRTWRDRCRERQTGTVAGATVAAPAAAPQGTVKTATVLQRGRKGRIVCYKEEVQPRRKPAAVEAAAPAPVIVTEPVAVAEPLVAAEPTVLVEEPVLVAVEEPSWTQYLAPDQPALLMAEPYTVTAPVYVEPAPVFQGGQQPIVIQPVIQPVVQPYGQPIVQIGQEVLGGQAQGAAPDMAYPVSPAYPEQSLIGIPPAIPGGALLVGPQAAYALAAPAAPYLNPYLNPYANPFGYSTVCPPGANCFTLPENQLAAGPQVFVPSAAGVAGVSLPPQALQTVLLSPPAAPATVALPPAAVAVQDKYGALTLPADEAARPVSRPEVSMPAPLGGTTVPPLAGPEEIENALNVMLGEGQPVLK